MDPIKHEFRKDGFFFRLVKMRRPFAIFAKKRPEHSRESFEVVRIINAPARTYPSGKAIPEHECMPWSESWGTYGFTYPDREGAEKRFAEMIEEEFAE